MSLLIQTYDRLGVLLDPKTGRPKMEPPFDKPGVLGAWGRDLKDPVLDQLPEHIQANLRLAELDAGPFGFRNSGLGWEEVIYTPNADGTAITSATETILLPDFSIPASYMTVGKILKYTIMGRVSTVITTPGVITLALRWGGVAGVVMATSAGFIPDVTAASTNLTFMVEWWTQQRTVGVAGTSMTFGRIEMPDPNDATIADFVIEYNKRLAPAATPAVATVDTTIDKLLSATFDQTVATGSAQAHIGILEAVN
jgi:hypothetical protein